MSKMFDGSYGSIKILNRFVLTPSEFFVPKKSKIFFDSLTHFVGSKINEDISTVIKLSNRWKLTKHIGKQMSKLAISEFFSSFSQKECVAFLLQCGREKEIQTNYQKIDSISSIMRLSLSALFSPFSSTTTWTWNVLCTWGGMCISVLYIQQETCLHIYLQIRVYYT